MKRSFDSLGKFGWGAVMMLCAAVLQAAIPAIILPEAPLPWEVTAKAELAAYWEKALPQGLTVAGTPVTEISLVRADDLPEESWFYHAAGSKLVIGGSGRGLLYGVWHFLEDAAGVRWLAADAEFIPRRTSPLVLEKCSGKGRPALLYRDIFTNNLSDDDGRFAARNRLNRRGDKPIAARYGGTFNYGAPYHCHTFTTYLPEAEFLKSHPEYFSLRGGKRAGGIYSGQPCLSNPNTGKIIYERLKTNILKERENAAKEQRPPATLFDLSINDNTKDCECTQCKARAAKIGRSGMLLHYLNPIAEKIAAEFPEIRLTTLAYLGYEALPLDPAIRPAKNLIVKLCDTQTNQAAPITAKENAGYLERVAQWGKITDNLFVWDYAVAYDEMSYPFASELDLATLMQEYCRHHVKGVFWEHEYPECGDMHELKFWMEAKMMEDPSRDAEALAADFCTHYYGAAGPAVLAARKAIRDAQRKNHGFVPWFAYRADFRYLDFAAVKQVCVLFDEAEKAAAGDPQLVSRLRRARFGMDLLAAERISGFDFIDRNALAKRLKFAAAGSDLPSSILKKQRPMILAQGALNYLNGPKKLPAPAAGTSELPLLSFANLETDCVEIAADPLAESGMAITIHAAKKPGRYAPPFEMGIHDTQTAKTLRSVSLKSLPRDGQYHWFEFPATLVNGMCYLYLSRSWRIRGRVLPCGAPARRMTGKIRMRFTGKLFNEPTADDPGTIRIDRICFTEM